MYIVYGKCINYTLVLINLMSYLSNLVNYLFELIQNFTRPRKITYIYERTPGATNILIVLV